MFDSIAEWSHLVTVLNLWFCHFGKSSLH